MNELGSILVTPLVSCIITIIGIIAIAVIAWLFWGVILITIFQKKYSISNFVIRQKRGCLIEIFPSDYPIELHFSRYPNKFFTEYKYFIEENKMIVWKPITIKFNKDVNLHIIGDCKLIKIDLSIIWGHLVCTAFTLLIVTFLLSNFLF